MKTPNKPVIFTVHPPVEFVYALNFIANEEVQCKFYLEFNFNPSEEFKQLVEEIKGKLSKHMRSELLYFFQWEDMIDIMGRILMENEKIKTVPEFISFIEQLDEKELQSYIIRQVLCDRSSSDESLVCWNNCEHINGNIRQLISEMDDKSDEEKDKLVECVENPSEIKLRMYFLMSQFYEKCYKPFEGKLLDEAILAKERYERLYHVDPEYFSRELLTNFFDFKYEKLVINISYFVQVRLGIFRIKPYNNTLWVNLGIHSEHYPRKVFITAKVQKFVKILSDKKRFEMIELLGKKPHYVHELAAELELTPPTVSYHLNSMLELNLVSVERGNNRTYYSLKKETVRELLDNAAEILLKSD